jgi:hypothetical protein
MRVDEPDAKAVKKALVEAGLEIYRTQGSEIHMAERVRLHIMDSGVRIALTNPPVIRFTARSQQSDFPHDGAETLFERVRGSVGSAANGRGFVEAGTASVRVTDPVDASRVLDVWHEVTYEKPAGDIEALIDEVRWALEVEKYIGS